jgi:hypothetical protein
MGCAQKNKKICLRFECARRVVDLGRELSFLARRDCTKFSLPNIITPISVFAKKMSRKFESCLAERCEANREACRRLSVARRRQFDRISTP